MALNSLQIDPNRIWKLNWRWYDETMLQTCDIRRDRDIPFHRQLDEHGLSFEEFLLLAECNGARVEAFRSDLSSESKLRTAIITASRHSDIVLVASYSRQALGQTG